MALNREFRILTALCLAGATMLGAHAADRKPQTRKHSAAHKQAVKQPSMEEQIQALKKNLEGRIDSLENRLAARDAQLENTQQQLAEAKAATRKAEEAAGAEQALADANAGAVGKLEAAVTALKAGDDALSTRVATETASVRKTLESPTALRYKGISLTPGGFLAGETVYRTHGTGSEIATPFASIPYEHSDAYTLSEFFGSGRQSRINLLAEGKLRWGTIRGFYEADFLGSGTTSNENQSNSYVMRQRLLYGEAETNSRWAFSGGQMWSLATENKRGISPAIANMALPLTVDPNYLSGFIWTRQYGFRVAKSFDRAALAVAIENPQLLYTATLAGNTPYAVLGSAGVNGGLMNATMSSCTPTTQIVNYTSQQESTSGGQSVNAPAPVYKTLSSCANLANISFNQAPDLLVKAAFDPGVGHYEVFGILRFAHETVYPGETTDRYLYGGLKDVLTGAVVVPALTSAGAISDSLLLGGGGASARIPVFKNKLSLGAKALVGDGVGRYDDTTLSDVTANAWGRLAPLHNLSGLLTAEWTPTSRLILWTNYGGDYAGRTEYTGTTLGAPTAAQNANGIWGAHWSAPTTAAIGYGSRLLSNSACLTNANPGYNGSSTGFYAGGSCGAQTRNVQEITGGYWYDIASGDHGRLRQGIQYGYLVREGWSGVEGIGAKGIENMLYTSFRYYLP